MFFLPYASAYVDKPRRQCVCVLCPPCYGGTLHKWSQRLMSAYFKEMHCICCWTSQSFLCDAEWHCYLLKKKQNPKKRSFLLSYSIVISKKKNFKHSPQASGQFRKAGGMGVLMGRGEIGPQRMAAPSWGERGDMACSDLIPVPLTPLGQTGHHRDAYIL